MILKMAMSFVTIIGGQCRIGRHNCVTRLIVLHSTATFSLNFPNSMWPTQICAANFKSKITVTRQIRKFDNILKIVWHN